MTGRVEGKIVLITGAARGLGRADALLLAREGATVIATDIRDGEAPPAGLFLRQDVTDEAAWIETLGTIRDRFGRLDVLVNNAGIVSFEDIEHETLDAFRRVNAVSSEATFLGCKHAIPLMRAGGGGSIINMSSITALRGFPTVIGYTAAKGAIRALSRTVAAHCAEKGDNIRCNTIFPGTIETPMTAHIADSESRARLGSPDDIANLVLYLASDESRFVSGAEFVVDNGYLA